MAHCSLRTRWPGLFGHERCIRHVERFHVVRPARDISTAYPGRPAHSVNPDAGGHLARRTLGGLDHRRNEPGRAGIGTIDAGNDLSGVDRSPVVSPANPKARVMGFGCGWIERTRDATARTSAEPNKAGKGSSSSNCAGANLSAEQLQL